MNIDRFSSQLNKHWSSISRYADLPIDEGNRPNVNPSSASVQPPRPSMPAGRARAQRSQQSRLKFEPKTSTKDRLGKPLKGEFDKDFSMGQATKEPVMPHNSPDSAFPRRKLRKRKVQMEPNLPAQTPSLNTPTIPSRAIAPPETPFQKSAFAGRKEMTFREQRGKQWQEKLPPKTQAQAMATELIPPVKPFPNTPDIEVPGIQEVSQETRRGRQKAIDLRQGRRDDDMSPPARKQTKAAEPSPKRRMPTYEELKANTPPSIPQGREQQRAAKLATEKDLAPPEGDFYQEPPESPDIYVDRDPQPEQRLPFPDPSRIGQAPDTRSGEAGNAEARRPRKADISPDGMQDQFSDAEETRGQPADKPAQQQPEPAAEQPADQTAEPDIVDAEKAEDVRPISQRMLDDTFDAWEVKPELTDKEFKETFGKTRGGMEREAHSMRRKQRVLQFNRENRIERDRDRAATRRWRRAMQRNTGAFTGGITNILGNFFINRAEQQNHARRLEFNEYMQGIDTEFVQKQADRSERNFQAKMKPLEKGGTYTESEFNAWYSQLPADQQINKDFLRTSGDFTIVPDGTDTGNMQPEKEPIDDFADRLDARKPGQPVAEMPERTPRPEPVHPHKENPELGEKAKAMLGDLADDELSKYDREETLHFDQFESLHENLKQKTNAFMGRPYNPSDAETLARTARRLHLAGYETNVPHTVEGIKDRHKTNHYKKKTENLFKRINRLTSMAGQDRQSSDYKNLENGIRIATKEIEDAGYGHLISGTVDNLETLKEQQLNNKINSLFATYKEYQDAINIEKNPPRNHQKTINDLHAQFTNTVQSLQNETGEDIGGLTSHLVEHHPEIESQDFRDLVDETSKPHQYVDVANSNLDRDEQEELLEQMTALGSEDDEDEVEDVTDRPVVSGEGQQVLDNFNVDVDGQIRPPMTGSIEQEITPAVNVTTADEEDDDPFVEDTVTAPVGGVEGGTLGEMMSDQLADTEIAPVATPSQSQASVPADAEDEDEESGLPFDNDADLDVDDDDIQHPLAEALFDSLVGLDREADFFPVASLLEREFENGRLDEISNMDSDAYGEMINGMLAQLDAGVISNPEDKVLSADEQESKQAHDAAVDRLVANNAAEYYRLHTDNASQSDVMRYKPEDVIVEPSRFQYKRNVDREHGVTGDYQSAEAWNPVGGGVLLGWKDPEDGQMYIVNGHHRMEMAKRLNAPFVDVRPIEAGSEKEARSIGAMMNIMENQGTPLDTAGYMRETNSSLDELKNVGLSLKKNEIATAYNLSNLLDGLWQMMVDGKLKQNQASLIGGILPEGDQQEAFWNNHGKAITKDTRLDNLEQRLRITKSQLQQVDGKKQNGLFGEGQLEVNSPAFYDLISAIENKARKGNRTGKALQSNQTKEFAGDRNVLDDEQNKQQELANDRILRLVNKIGLRHDDEIFNGFMSQLNESAQRIDNAPTKGSSKLLKQVADQIYKKLKFEMENVDEDSMHYSAYGNALSRISRQCIRRQFNIQQYMARKFTRQDHLQNRVAAFWEVELN